ncbi:MAG TPA: hypothetical protein PK089_06315 [Methanoregulaceae archaeon]|nr:hypothetical protein [Methanoregulaceae archaeon]HQJ87044.1 hypothetical protein [Methanoregulaceae archaeon]
MQIRTRITRTAIEAGLLIVFLSALLVLPVSASGTISVSNPLTGSVVAAPTVVPGAFTVPPGTGTFSVTSVGNVPVGSDGVVQLLVDNGWSPLFGDTYIDISWDPTLIAYQSTRIRVLNTTAAISNDRTLRIMLGDFRRGYPQGRYPLADITFRALREGTSTLSVSVDHVRYWNDDFTEFSDITGTASGRNGLFSTGPLPVETLPLVTFTQNTLPPGSYSTDLDPTKVATSTRTPTPSAAPDTPVITEETVTAVVVSSTPVPTPSPDHGTYAPASTRVEDTKKAGSPVVPITGLLVATVLLLAARRKL